jgi:aminoglycoside phosphotransferase (APT) family kinase protein
VIAVEEDESFLGAPFIVMSCVEGRALPDLPPYTFGGSFLDDLDTIGRAEFQRNFVHTQARIHAIDLDTVDTSFIGPASGDVLDRQLIAQRSYFDWARDGLDIPIIDEGLEWLAANRPVDPGDTVVNWGDARPGNLLVAGIRPVAALDWEMVDLGPAGVDVGWAIFMHSFFQFVAAMFDLPGFPDLFQVDEVMADYVAAGGSEIRDLDWYVMYGSVRFAIISVRTSSREIAYGNRPPVDDPEDLIMHLPMLREQLASR